MVDRRLVRPNLTRAMHRAFASVCAVLIAGLALPLRGGFAAGAIEPNGTATSTGASWLTANQAAEPSKSTFGLGPASASKFDGRSAFTFFSSPGGHSDDHLGIVNLSATSLVLRVYATNAVQSSNGGIGYAGRQVHPTDVASWITVHTRANADSVSVPPSRTTILPLSLAVPIGAYPGDHTGAIVVALTSKVIGRSGQLIDFEQRVATRVSVRVSGDLNPRLSVEGLHAEYHRTMNPLAAGTATVTYTVRNTGNVDLGGRQKVTLSGPVSATGRIGAIADVPLLLPGASTRIRLRFADVRPEFRMRVRVRVTPLVVAGTVNPGLRVASATATFWAIPWTAALAFPLLIAASAAAARWRRRRTRRTAGRHHPPRNRPDPVVPAGTATP